MASVRFAVDALDKRIRVRSPAGTPAMDKPRFYTVLSGRNRALGPCSQLVAGMILVGIRKPCGAAYSL